MLAQCESTLGQLWGSVWRVHSRRWDAESTGVLYLCTGVEIPVDPRKYKTFVWHLYNVGPTSSTLVQHCTNVIKCFVLTGTRLYRYWPLSCHNAGPESLVLTHIWSNDASRPCICPQVYKSGWALTEVSVACRVDVCDVGTPQSRHSSMYVGKEMYWVLPNVRWTYDGLAQHLPGFQIEQTDLWTAWRRTAGICSWAIPK